MRNPEIILNTLSSHSKVSDYKYERIYRILFNEEMFMLAYERIKSKPGNMTPGTDGLTIDGMTIDHIGKLIECLKDESYSPLFTVRMFRFMYSFRIFLLSPLSKRVAYSFMYLSNWSRYILANMGLTIPPWGVPE